jgi:hypothetical protein
VRLACVFALCALLYDGSACFVAFMTAPPADPPQELSMRAPCPCGCAQHLATLIGVGLSQPAAPQALAALPPAAKPAPLAAPVRRLPEAPPRVVDHVPIALA